MTGEEAGPFRDELSKREYMISGLGQEAQDKVFGMSEEEQQVKKAHVEDAESAITPEDLKTIETVKSLAGGKAKGSPFKNPEKEIQKAYGKILSQVAGKIKNIKI